MITDLSTIVSPRPPATSNQPRGRLPMLVATSKRGGGLAARGVVVAALRLFSFGTFTPSQQNDLAAGQRSLPLRSERPSATLCIRSRLGPRALKAKQ